MDDPMIKSELGRLSFFGELTDTQAQAGFTIGDLYRRYREGGRSQNAGRTSNHDSGRYGSGIRIVRKTKNKPDSVARAEEDAWRSVENELEATPHKLHQAIIELCVENRAINPILYAEVRRFFDQIAQILDPYWQYFANDSLTIQRPSQPRSAAAPRQFDEDAIEEAAMKGVIKKYIATLCPNLDSEGVAQQLELLMAFHDREEYRMEKGLGDHRGAV